MEPIEPTRLEPARVILEAAVKQRAFPGAVLAVGRQSATSTIAVGRLAYELDAPAVTADTIYDLASLTKVVATTTAAMMLSEQGKLLLDRPVAFYLPDFVEPYDTAADPLWAARGDVTVRHLLAHTAGLPAYEQFFLRAREKSHVLEEALALPLDDLPGRKTVYSDIGFILLGAIVEQAAGQSLDAYCDKELLAPLGMKETRFNPPQELWDRIAPTEQDNEFRKRLIRGEVHDENSWVMGGVAGHAGLFGTAAELAAFCRMLLAGGRVKERQILKPETIAEFTRTWPAAEGPARGLGWDKPNESPSCGRHFSVSSYGHLGFTGTSLWIDPEQHLFIVLLTNRVHPTRSNEVIRQVRPAVHDAVVEAF